MNEQEKAARAAGAAAADKVIRAQASAGVSTDRIEAHGADTASLAVQRGENTLTAGRSPPAMTTPRRR